MQTMDCKTNLVAGNSAVPLVDVLETASEVLLLADLPGVRKEDLEVFQEGRQLTIQGVRPKDAVRQTKPLLEEFRPRSFRRTFRVGDELDSATLTAQLKDGVLCLSIPKKAGAVRRKVEIREGI